MKIKLFVFSIIAVAILLVATVQFISIDKDNTFDFCNEDKNVNSFSITPTYESMEQAMFYEKIKYELREDCE